MWIGIKRIGLKRDYLVKQASGHGRLFLKVIHHPVLSFPNRSMKDICNCMTSRKNPYQSSVPKMFMFGRRNTQTEMFRCLKTLTIINVYRPSINTMIKLVQRKILPQGTGHYRLGGGGDVRLGGFWMTHNKNLPDPFIGLCDVLTVAFSLIGSWFVANFL